MLSCFEKEIKNESLKGILKYTGVGLALAGISAFGSYLLMPYLISNINTLLIAASIVAIIASIVMSSQANDGDVKVVKIAFATMSICIGFSLSPEMYLLVHSQNGILMLLLSLLTLILIVSALYAYASRHRNSTPRLSNMVLLYCFMLLFCFGIVYAAVPTALTNILYCGAGIVIFSLFLVSDIAIALDDKNNPSEAQQIIIAANIMLDIINIFLFIINAMSGEKSKDIGFQQAFKIFIAVVCIPFTLYQIITNCLFSSDKKEVTPGGAGSTMGSHNIQQEGPDAINHPISRTEQEYYVNAPPAYQG